MGVLASTISRPAAGTYTGLDIANYSSDSPILVLSNRRINSGYTGPLIRLRRSTDSVESDFGSGLAMGDFLDYSAIDTWLSGGTAYVVKWYDQSGQGRDLQQATASRQPILSASATTGRAVQFSGLSDCHLSSVSQVSGGFFSSGPAISVHHATDTNDAGFCANMSVSTAPHVSGNITYFRTNRYSTANRFSWRGTQFQPSGTPAAAGNEYLYYHHDGSNLRVDHNATQIGSTPNTTAAHSSGDSFNLGADATAQEWEGYTYELIIFDSSQATADSDAVRDDMNSTYTLYT